MKFANRDATSSHQPLQVPSQLDRDVILECVDPLGRSVDIPTRLSYRSHDPFAITLTFHSESSSVEWLIGRNQLLLGLAAPVGDGDVRIRPSFNVDGLPVTIFTFTSPDGCLVAQAPREDIEQFLTASFAAVPSGTETAHLDVDLLIQNLLTP